MNHINDKSAQKMIRKAIKQVGIIKHATCHTFRHSFATHLLENGYGRFFTPPPTVGALGENDIHYIHVNNIRTVQELMGHSIKRMIVATGIVPPATLVHPEHRTRMFLIKVGMVLKVR